MSTTDAMRISIDYDNGDQLRVPEDDDASTRARSYQMEMLRKSLKQNIIVAMGTGSGKTHIAILRILEQINRGDTKICWFLVPGVELGRQQCNEVKKYLRVGNVQFLSGNDGPEKWSTQDIWDDILGLKEEEPSVIVSTYQVLLDALSHGFVSMSNLSLLVFDEAHHCVGDDPSSRIMRDFYHPLLKAGEKDKLPHILGLTASPIVRSSPDRLRQLEENLDAIALAPSETKEELEKHMHPPTIKCVYYDNPHKDDYGCVDAPTSSPSTTARIPAQPPTVGGSWIHHLDMRKLMGATLSNRRKLPTAYDLDESEFEHIDPKTGLPVGSVVPESREVEMEMQFEMIDPRTGEPYTAQALASQAKKPPTPPYSPSLKRLGADDITGAGSEEPSPHKKSRLNRRSDTFDSLMLVYQNLDVNEDPYVKRLNKRLAEIPPDYEDERQKVTDQLNDAIKNKNTYSWDNLRKFVTRSEHILGEYGIWSVEWFIKEAIKRYLNDGENDDFDPEDERDILEMEYWGESEEKRYLRKVLRTVKCTPDFSGLEEEGQLTNKVEKLINVLAEEYESAEWDPENGKKKFTALVFVEQRVGVRVLAEILSIHSKTKDILRISTMVGEATMNYARSSKTLHDIVLRQGHSLTEFKNGKKNLVISTSVLEEGIDVPICNLVVCFELPKNVKSYIQRRGRARSVKSTYVLMIGDEKDLDYMKRFSALEKEMVQLYEDEQRALENSTAELDGEEESIASQYKFQVPGGTALLTMENAIPFLHHFCAASTKTKYINLKPEFRTEAGEPAPLTKTNDNKYLPIYSATVTLPSSLAPEVRHAQSTRKWKTEKLAKRHAAYEAYLKLWHANLLNDNLMPLSTGDPEADEFHDIERRASSALVDVTMDPWATVNADWWTGDVYVTPLTVSMPDGEVIKVEMFLPCNCPRLDDIVLYWTNNSLATVKVGKSRYWKNEPEVMERVREYSYRFMWTAFYNRMREEDGKDFPYFFLPEGFENWNKNPKTDSGMVDEKPALEAFSADDNPRELGLVRDHNDNRFVFRGWVTDQSPRDLGEEILGKRYPGKEVSPDQPLLEVFKLPKRRDFLHQDKNVVVGDATEKKKMHLVPQYCSVSQFPWRYTQLALFMPCVIRRVEISVIAATLQKTVLAPINLEKTSNILTAISAASAMEPTNYERYEFLGDCVLKFLTSVQLMDEKPNWHEGYLSGKKDSLVNNARLSKEATNLGLGKFIVTKIFTGSKWKPKSLKNPEEGIAGQESIEAMEVDQEAEKEEEQLEEEQLEEEQLEEERREEEQREEEQQSGFKIGKDERSLSTKTLADVVESLLGVAYLEGGYDKAVEYVKIFGGDISWKPVHDRINSLYQKAAKVSEENRNFPYHGRELEKLIGYEFKNESLLFEAILHPSWPVNASSTLMNYQRLEFLGDAVLDMIVINYLFSNGIKKFSHVNMHLLKTAVVNADFLAFLSLELSMEVEVKKVVDQKPVTVKARRAFWEHLRHGHPDIYPAQQRVVKSWTRLRESIRKALDHDKEYPWTLLMSMGADKFFSDIVESVLGAAFVDSKGDFKVVERIAETMGILPQLRRLVHDNVDVSHPRKKLGELVAAGQGELDYEVDMPVKGGKYTCRVKVNDEVIATVEGMSMLHAKAKGADEAYSILLRNGWKHTKEVKEMMLDKKKKRKKEGKEKKDEILQILEI